MTAINDLLTRTKVLRAGVTLLHEDVAAQHGFKGAIAISRGDVSRLAINEIRGTLSRLGFRIFTARGDQRNRLFRGASEVFFIR